MNIKDYPKTCSKQELYDLLKPISTREIRQVVNEVIATNRKISIPECKAKQIVYINECKDVLVYFGHLEE